MESDALTLYKLIILFLLDKVDFPLTNVQLSNVILEKDYTNYFNVQQSISELVELELVSVALVSHSSHYRITDSGKETLSFFHNRIPSSIQEEILAYLKENQYSLRDEVSTFSEYFEIKKGEYMVRLRVLENKEPIIDLSITVPAEEEAVKICRNWRSQSQRVYAFILSNLLKED